jgi:hypothetical protein
MLGKAIIAAFLHMGKLVQASHIQWSVMVLTKE